MSFTAVLLNASGSVVHTLGTHIPFIAPSYAFEYTEDEPPILSAITKTWLVRGKLYATGESNTAAAWAALATACAGGTVKEVQFLRGAFVGGTVIDSIGGSSGYDVFKIEALESPTTDLQWRGEMEYGLRITGRKVIANALGLGSISKLEQTESYSYDESGLLLRTLSGTLEVGSSSSAASAVLSLGLQLPGATFGYVTNGPGGVEYEILNRADTKASFRSSIQENAYALPSGVGPSYSKTTRTTREGGVETTTIRVVANGVGAEAAVRALNPGKCLTRTIDVRGREAEGTFVYQAQVDGASYLKTRTFAIRGGGAPIRFTRRTGGYEPAVHIGARTEVVITELCIVEARGAPGPNNFLFPPPLTGTGIYEDTDEQAWDPFITRTVIGADRAGDVWTCGLRRVYKAASANLIVDAIGKAAVAPGASSKFTDELARKSSGGKR